MQTKPLSRRTQEVVDDLRGQKRAIEGLFGTNSLTHSLGTAISRLSLLDTGLQTVARESDFGPRSWSNVKDVVRIYLEKQS